VWLLPSRSRPQNIVRLVQVEFRSPVMLALDFDDPMLGGYHDLDLPKGWGTMTCGHGPLSELYNCFFATYPSLDWYGFLADDVLPSAPDWDRKLIAAAGRDGLAFGDDGINGEKHAPHFVLGGDLVREFGWLALPGLDRIYIDTVWNDIARDRGVMRYLPDVKMPHLHFSNRRALMDVTYRKQNKARDRAIYEEWRRLSAGPDNVKETTHPW